MFVVTCDGDPRNEAHESVGALSLVQRWFVFELLQGGISVVLLNTMEFRDSKVRQRYSILSTAQC
jgi:hypothetical protein